MVRKEEIPSIPLVESICRILHGEDSETSCEDGAEDAASNGRCSASLLLRTTRCSGGWHVVGRCGCGRLLGSEAGWCDHGHVVQWVGVAGADRWVWNVGGASWVDGAAAVGDGEGGGSGDGVGLVVDGDDSWLRAVTGGNVC